MKNRKEPLHLTSRYVNEKGCLLCSNIPNHDGYIRVKCYSENRLIMLHVKEWEAVNGKKPDGMELNHKCGNRGCCNVEHLELLDGSAHATLTNVSREGYIMDRRSDSEIHNIYALVKYGGFSINKICKAYSMKRSTLSSIMNKRSRTSVTDKVDELYLTTNHNP